MSRNARYINYKENEGFLFVTFEPHGCMSFRGVSYATYIDATENFECEAVRTWLKD